MGRVEIEGAWGAVVAGDAEVRAVRARARVADNPAHHVERAPHVRGGFRVSGRTSAARLREHLEPARLHLRGGAHGRRARPVRERPRKQVVNDVRLDIPQALEVQLGGFLAEVTRNQAQEPPRRAVLVMAVGRCKACCMRLRTQAVRVAPATGAGGGDAGHM